jgi:hypothetical protein
MHSLTSKFDSPRQDGAQVRNSALIQRNWRREVSFGDGVWCYNPESVTCESEGEI